jgi:hypothetical protein
VKLSSRVAAMGSRDAVRGGFPPVWAQCSLLPLVHAAKSGFARDAWTDRVVV